MVTAAIWVTTTCNLNCSYCYEGELKKNKSMDFKTAEKIIEFIIEYIKKKNEDNLIINYHGGEPFLEFKIIKFITQEISRKANEINKKVVFGATTNGTLINTEIKEFLYHKPNFHISVSLDGAKETHDSNRVYRNGNGTYNKIVPICLEMLKKRPDIRARMTFNSCTVNSLYENIVHLADLGFNVIASAPNYFDNGWNAKSMSILSKELEKVYNFVELKKKYNTSFRVGLVDATLKKKKGPCSGGINSININPEGYIFPCTYVVENQKYIIGDVKTGIDLEKVNNFQLINKGVNTECEGCNYMQYCISTRCKVVNELLTGQYDVPSPVVCSFANLEYKFLKV